MNETASTEGPARRFLHFCYCCEDTDQVSNFFVEGLHLKEVMRNPLHPSDGSLLGIDGEIVSGAAFLYDRRGPRTSPSIEVQEWVSPKMVGRPRQDPTEVGMQALGISTSRASRVVESLREAGASLLASGATPWTGEWYTVADPNGVVLDIVDDPTVPADESRIRHLRIAVSDLATSIPWYRRMGFVDVDRHELRSASFLSSTLESVELTVQRMRLPDEACEVVLMQWHDPVGHGRHPSVANHAGLYRTAVGVDDTRRSYDEFRAAGVEFVREPREVELTGTKVPDMWICFLDDPDGVPYEFVQRPRSAFRPG